jgi:hypothetical protein
MKIKIDWILLGEGEKRDFGIYFIWIKKLIKNQFRTIKI